MDSADTDPKKQRLLSVTEACLRPLSRSASVTSVHSPSVILEIPSETAPVTEKAGPPPDAQAAPQEVEKPDISTVLDGSCQTSLYPPLPSILGPVFRQTPLPQLLILEMRPP